MERIITKKLKNGLTLYVIPKRGYVQAEAMFTVRYGSTFTNFEVNGQKITTPPGIAHFLEHKLFEDKNGNLFDKFSNLGANANAFTNFHTTAYYFTTTENFYENLQLLCYMISSTFLTDENIKKEKNIIEQEINMYKDDSNWQCYFNMLTGMYKTNPVRNNIAGTIDSLYSINKQQLELCYNSFYTGDNMALIVTGDVDINKIEIIALQTDISYGKIVRVEIRDNHDTVNEAYIEQKMNVEKPVFSIGFKEMDYSSPLNIKAATSIIIMDILSGLSSDLYTKMYNENLIEDDFYFEHLNGFGYGADIFSGTSDEPYKVAENIIKQINFYKENGIKPQVINRIIRKNKGKIFQAYNSLGYICNTIADNFAKKQAPLENLDMFDKISYSDIERRLINHFKEENMVISVIN